MCNFEQETVLIWSHVGLGFPGHPYEPRQPRPQGPQQVINILTSINFLSILHEQFLIRNCFNMVPCWSDPSRTPS